ncbi:glycosyltransferase family 4 protein [Oerskovia jenensis]|uniref:Glycosyltransferase involved in cell wall biosynthesis n=1 Tax=Oerskovia jenensis TaxID=162169 RepID=A0ABS2LJP9_9CELL|nr:glycosyltransferase family 1 protein [Oerskovia jenensis]MBM7480364.1 glycosyltransferase involved in cell wall biosynthesis [Oerskovia jenensis]
MTASPAPVSVSMTVEQLWQPVPGGSGTYIRRLAEHLAARDDVRLTGVRARGTLEDRRGLPSSMPLVASSLPRRALYASWNSLRAPRVPGPPTDVIHATTWAVPPRSAPLVVTVHDVAFRRNSSHFTPHGVRYFEKALQVVRREADLVIVPSVATRDDCVEAGLSPERLRVVPHGTSAAPVTEDEVTAWRAAHGVHRDFVLWCGTFEPRKNVGALLAAFSTMLGEGTDLDLVLIGPTGWGGTSAEVRAVVDRLPADRVHLLGKVPEQALQVAYRTAAAFCFPSLWEGFGMPVLEAMAHGTPVVTSEGTSMAEVSGAGALLVDPTSPDALADAIRRAAGPEHDLLAAAALENASTYTWARAADLTVAAYRDAASGAGR